MATPVEVPKLGNTVEECIIGRWVKHAGDAVAAGDVVAEIETDKTTFEVTAPVGGTVLATFFEEGAVAPVFTNFFVIGAAGENADAFRPKAAGAPVREPAPPSPVAGSVPATGGSAAGAPVAGSVLAGSVTAVGSTPMGGAAIGTAARMSPRAKRFAEVHNFRPGAVTGSGPGGRILEADLRQLFEARPRSAAKSSRLRETIARRMRESLASTAQYTMHASADAAGLMVLRARIKASVGTADININHLITYCTIRALMEVPSLNAEFIDGKLEERAAVDLGFACDTPKGLLVPVVRGAQALSLTELAARMKDLTARAVVGTIPVDDLSGGSFTISNLGNLGIEWFTPLLNPPQVAILGVNAIQLKPVRRDGRVEFIDAVGLSLTCDHQAIDGAPGARFLQVLKAKIEGVEAECQNRF
jgi:pyruvate dehydrogenase E2 component (dihydrolipoamide acetyltransferase)